MGNSSQQIQTNRNKTGIFRRLLLFLTSNWIVILILLMFVSQIYVVLQIRKIAVRSEVSSAYEQEQMIGNNINQMKSMMSSMYGRINTIQGDINYLKGRR